MYYPEIPYNITIQQLLSYQGHLGGKLSQLHPASGVFAFGRRWSMLFLDTRLSIFFLRRSLGLCVSISFKNGQVFFTGGFDAQSAYLANLFYTWNLLNKNKLFIVSCFNWFGGTLTNFKNWSRFVNSVYLYLQTASSDNYFYRKYFKALYHTFGGLTNLHLIPPVIVSFNLPHHLVVKTEARGAGIPLIALADLSIDPVGILYPIACNNQSLGLHFYMLSVFLIGILVGRNRRIRQFRFGVLRFRVILFSVAPLIHA